MSVRKKRPVRKPAATEMGFRPRERRIYSYFDGSQMVSRDPMELQEGIAAFPDLDLEMEIKTMTAQSPQLAQKAKESFDRVVACVRQVFGVPPYQKVNGKATGLTKEECVNLLCDFAAFVARLKKNTRSSLISGNPSAATPSDGPSRTPNGADLCSTGIGASTAAP